MRIAFQGERGAYSDLAALHFRADSERVACASFEDVIEGLRAGAVDLAAIPVQNSIAGPVTTAIALLEKTDFTVVQSDWRDIRHNLLALPGSTLADIRSAHSHWQALRQCQDNIAALGLTAIEEYDTAGAAKLVAERGDKSQAAIASSLAAKEYGLHILREDFADAAGNRTFFLLLARRENAKGTPVKISLQQMGLS